MSLSITQQDQVEHVLPARVYGHRRRGLRQSVHVPRHQTELDRYRDLAVGRSRHRRVLA